MKILKLTMKKFDKTKDVIIDNSENQTNQLKIQLKMNYI